MWHADCAGCKHHILCATRTALPQASARSCHQSEAHSYQHLPCIDFWSLAYVEASPNWAQLKQRATQHAWSRNSAILQAAASTLKHAKKCFNSAGRRTSTQTVNMLDGIFPWTLSKSFKFVKKMFALSTARFFGRINTPGVISAALGSVILLYAAQNEMAFSSASTLKTSGSEASDSIHIYTKDHLGLQFFKLLAWRFLFLTAVKTLPAVSISHAACACKDLHSTTHQAPSRHLALGMLSQHSRISGSWFWKHPRKAIISGTVAYLNDYTSANLASLSRGESSRCFEMASMLGCHRLMQRAEHARICKGLCAQHAPQFTRKSQLSAISEEQKPGLHRVVSFPTPESFQ